MYAIVRSGGRQHRVEEGRAVNVERLPTEEGETVELGEVLLIADDGDVTVGTPLIEGARVLAQVEAHGRDKKITVFKYKAKVRTRKKTGHRQHFTRLAVTEILRPGQKSKAAAKPKRRRRTKATEAAEEAPVAEATEETPAPVGVAAEQPVADAPATEAPAPKRRTRRKAAEEAGKAEAADETAPAAEASVEDEGGEKPKATRRRSTRRKTEEKKETTE